MNGTHPLLQRPGLRLLHLTAPVTDAQSGLQKPNFPNVSGMTGGGDDTTSPYHRRTPTGSTGEPARRRHRPRTTPTPPRPILSRSPPTPPPRAGSPPRSPAATTRRSRRSSRSTTAPTPAPGIDAASGIVERDSAPLTTATAPATPSAAPGRRSRSPAATTRPSHRQLLPLPLPALRPGRQPGDLGRQRDRQGRHERPGRPEPRLRLAHERRQSPAPPSTTAPRPVTGQFAVTALRPTPSPESPPTASRCGLGLERLRLGRRAHLQPLRLAHRSGRAERRHGPKRRRPRPPAPPASRSRQTQARRRARFSVTALPARAGIQQRSP